MLFQSLADEQARASLNAPLGESAKDSGAAPDDDDPFAALNATLNAVAEPAADEEEQEEEPEAALGSDVASAFDDLEALLT